MGQGAKKSSIKFKPLEYDSTKTRFTQISVSNDAALAIDQDGQLWGWGMNTSHRLGLSDMDENGISKPFKLYNLNNLGFKALRVSLSEHHSLVLFETAEKLQVLYSVGVEVADSHVHLGCAEDQAMDPEKPFRPLEQLSQRNILDFKAHDSQSSFVLVAGDDTQNNGLYNHQLPNGRKTHGLVHFFKQNGKWEFVTEDEYEAITGTSLGESTSGTGRRSKKERQLSKIAELPPICFVMRCPISDIASKEWPDLEKLAAEILEDLPAGTELVHSNFENSADNKPVSGPLYYSKSLINNEEIEVCHSETTVRDVTNIGIHPTIYLRIAKPIKKDSVLPLFALEKFYDLDQTRGITMEIVPNMTIEKNNKLVELTRESWDSLCDNIAKFDLKWQAQFLKALDSLVTDKDINTYELQKEFNPSDLKYGENDSADLKKLPENIAKQIASLFWMLNKNFFTALVYSCKEQKCVKDSTKDLLNGVKACLL